MKRQINQLYNTEGESIHVLESGSREQWSGGERGISNSIGLTPLGHPTKLSQPQTANVTLAAYPGDDI